MGVLKNGRVSAQSWKQCSFLTLSNTDALPLDGLSKGNFDCVALTKQFWHVSIIVRHSNDICLAKCHWIRAHCPRPKETACQVTIESSDRHSLRWTRWNWSRTIEAVRHDRVERQTCRIDAQRVLVHSILRRAWLQKEGMFVNYKRKWLYFFSLTFMKFHFRTTLFGLIMTFN